MDQSDLMIMALSIGMKLLAVLIALCVAIPGAVYLSQHLDRRAGIKSFAETILVIDSDPKAAAIYRSGRFRAICILIGLAVGLALH